MEPVWNHELFINGWRIQGQPKKVHINPHAGINYCCFIYQYVKTNQEWVGDFGEKCKRKSSLLWRKILDQHWSRFRLYQESSQTIQDFVANRIQIIRKELVVKQWKYVSARSSSADDGSRQYSQSHLLV